MTFRSIRLLCVEKEPNLLKSRCALLRQHGYDVRGATPLEAETLLLTEEVDLVIVSSCLSGSQEHRLLAVAREVATQVLQVPALAAELVAQVDLLLLRPASSEIPN